MPLTPCKLKRFWRERDFGGSKSCPSFPTQPDTQRSTVGRWIRTAHQAMEWQADPINLSCFPFFGSRHCSISSSFLSSCDSFLPRLPPTPSDRSACRLRSFSRGQQLVHLWRPGTSRVRALVGNSQPWMQWFSDPLDQSCCHMITIAEHYF